MDGFDDYKQRKIYDEQGLQELTEEEKEHRYQVSTDARDQLMQLDKDNVRLERKIDHAKDFHRCHWNKQVQVEEWSKDEILEELKAARRDVGFTQKIGITERGKRVDHFRAKVKNQKKLTEELSAYSAARKNALIDAGISSVMLDKKDRNKDKTVNKFSKELSGIAMNWVPFLSRIYDAEKQDAQVNQNRKARALPPGQIYKGLMKDEETSGLMLSDMLTYLQNADMTEFAYRDDASFLHDYAKKYEKLKAFADAEKIIAYLKSHNNGKFVSKDGLNGGVDEAKTVILGKAAVAKELLSDYEGRMHIMQSPYYALFAGKDFEKLTTARIRGMKREVIVNGKDFSALNDYLDSVIAWKNKKANSYKGVDIAAKVTEKMALSVEQEAKVRTTDDMFSDISALVSTMAADTKSSSAFRNLRTVARSFRDAQTEDGKKQLLHNLRAASQTYLDNRGAKSYAYRKENAERLMALIDEYNTETARLAMERYNNLNKELQDRQDEAAEKNRQKEEFEELFNKQAEKSANFIKKRSVEEAELDKKRVFANKVNIAISKVTDPFGKLAEKNATFNNAISLHGGAMKFLEDYLGKEESAKYEKVPMHLLVEGISMSTDSIPEGEVKYKETLKNSIATCAAKAEKTADNLKAIDELYAKKDEELTAQDQLKLYELGSIELANAWQFDKVEYKSFHDAKLAPKDIAKLLKNTRLAKDAAPEEGKGWDTVSKEMREQSKEASVSTLALLTGESEELFKLLPVHHLSVYMEEVMKTFFAPEEHKEAVKKCVKHAKDIQKLQKTMNGLVGKYEKLQTKEAKAGDGFACHDDVMKFLEKKLGKEVVKQYKLVPTHLLTEAISVSVQTAAEDDFVDQFNTVLNMFANRVVDADANIKEIDALSEKKDEELSVQDQLKLYELSSYALSKALGLDEVTEYKSFHDAQVSVKDLAQYAKNVHLAKQASPQPGKDWKSVSAKLKKQNIAANSSTLSLLTGKEKELFELIPINRLDYYAKTAMESFFAPEEKKKALDECLALATAIKERKDKLEGAVNDGTADALRAVIIEVTGNESLSDATTDEYLSIAKALLDDVSDEVSMKINHQTLVAELDKARTEEVCRERFLAADKEIRIATDKGKETDPKTLLAYKEYSLIYVKKALRLPLLPKELSKLSDADMYTLVSNIGIIKSLTIITDEKGKEETISRRKLNDYERGDYDKALAAINGIKLPKNIKEAVKTVLKPQMSMENFFVEKPVELAFYDPLPYEKTVSKKIFELREKERLTGKKINFSNIVVSKKKEVVEKTSEEWSMPAQSVVNLVGDMVNLSANPTVESMRKLLLKSTEALVNTANAFWNTEVNFANPFDEVSAGVTKEEQVLINGMREAFETLIKAVVKEGKKDEKLKDNPCIMYQDILPILQSKNFDKVLEQLVKDVEKAIQDGEKEVTDLMDEATEDVFDQLEGMGLPNILGSSKEDKDKKDDRELLDYMQNNLRFDRTQGQGKFIQGLMSNYYKDVDKTERRRMLSCIVKDFKKNEKGKTDKEKGGSYFASTLKGAGPLMQKIMQGVPERMVIPELREAIGVVKSNLESIDSGYVRQVIDEMKKASNKKITSIAIDKPLGAASVAETFLCKISGPGIKKKPVVIKILRPDAKERMAKELPLMRRAAMFADMKDKDIEAYKKTEKDKTVLGKHTQKVTESGFLAQYSEIEKEFDFRNEAKNCKRGAEEYVNKKKNVDSVHIYEEMPSSDHYIVMDQADGITLDRYISNTRSEVAKVKELHKNPSGSSANKDKYVFDRISIEAQKAELITINKMLRKSVRYAQNVADLTEVWIDKALFGASLVNVKGSNFHHGDMHAGNIMVGKKGTTVLDYGNAAAFSNSKVTEILRMMAAVVVDKPDFFVEAFSAMVDIAVEEDKQRGDKKIGFEPMTDEQKKVYQEKLEAIFELGKERDSGKKIMVALTTAQELGIKLPLEIQNFSQCQQRLENTVDEIRQTAIDIKSEMETLERMPLADEVKDIPDVYVRLQKLMNEKENGKYKYTKIEALEELKKDYSMVDSGMVTADVGKVIDAKEYETERAKFFERYLPKYAGLATNFIREDEFEKRIPQWRGAYNALKKCHEENKPLDEKSEKVLSKFSDLIESSSKESLWFGNFIDGKEGRELKDRALNRDNPDSAAFERLMLIFEYEIPREFRYAKSYTDFFDHKRKKEKETEEVKMKYFRQLSECTNYSTINALKKKKFGAQFLDYLHSHVGNGMEKVFETDMARMFKFADGFEEAYSSYKELILKRNSLPKDASPEEVRKLQESIDAAEEVLIANVAMLSLQEISELINEEEENGLTIERVNSTGLMRDFVTVMGDVIDDNIFTAAVRLGKKYKTELERKKEEMEEEENPNDPVLQKRRADRIKKQEEKKKKEEEKRKKEEAKLAEKKKKEEEKRKKEEAKLAEKKKKEEEKAKKKKKK
ncbi:MAG: hypothetical protein K6G07_06425 [Lachnospiraceae bacterium]|nr:hypothetical protein [Lachnospiraceae bacterium]